MILNGLNLRGWWLSLGRYHSFNYLLNFRLLLLGLWWILLFLGCTWALWTTLARWVWIAFSILSFSKVCCANGLRNLFLHLFYLFNYSIIIDNHFAFALCHLICKLVFWVKRAPLSLKKSDNFDLLKMRVRFRNFVALIFKEVVKSSASFLPLLAKLGIFFVDLVFQSIGWALIQIQVTGYLFESIFHISF